jgi:hypothetical protein
VKTILILCGLIVVIGGGLLYFKLRLPTHFGTFTDAPKAEVADLIERPKDYLHRTITIEGVVREQCTTMGCYFFFHSGKRKLRVDISEIAMNAPRRNGRRARVEGQIVPYADGYQFWASAVQFE